MPVTARSGFRAAPRVSVYGRSQSVFSRVAIVNRGEAAMRLIHAVRDLSAETGTRIETVALYTDAEPAATFIGPDAEAMRKLGDKIGAKLIAEEVGVPVAPWSRGAVATLDEALQAAQGIGYPLMLKATAGGGGRGIRVVASAADLTEAFERTSAEALRAFGNGTVFLERLVTGARHVEVQVIADGQGTAWALGVRDCSVQRRNQKVIEESSSPVLAPEQAADLKAS